MLFSWQDCIYLQFHLYHDSSLLFCLFQDNHIKTSKYNIFTFLPINLFEQFQRVANAYFLFLLILQLIPQVSSLSWFTTIVPLALVLTITAVKDATDDYVSIAKALGLGPKVSEQWMNVRVGDIIKLENNQFVAADLLLLSSSEPYGLSYVETAELDGETNLKVRQALTVTSDLCFRPFTGEVVCEPPNNKLDRFTGTLLWKDGKFPLDNGKLLLRGCVLRNTEWCFGMVIFAGLETKLMQNCGRTTFKRTSIDRLMNTLVLWIFGFLMCMGIILAIGNSVWEKSVGGNFRKLYLPWDEVLSDAFFSGFLTFWSYIIILNTVVPISLYVSVEVIRLGHSYFINWDRRMYQAQRDTPAEARTTTLNEELGQVEYIFSDKTGTLTQNIMVFSKCSINGKIYDSADAPRRLIPKKTPCVDFSFNPLRDRRFRFHDHSLLEAMKLDETAVREFFRLLALCHTVMPEEKMEGELVYQAQSPDEGALVTAARNFGFVFRARTPETITVYELGKAVTYQLLAILDFNNVRKRMSVIVRNPQGRARLYCKGADTILFDRLEPASEELLCTTSEHLNEFAGEGLRTLALAYRDLDEDFFQGWMQRLREACSLVEKREDLLASLYEEMEREMTLLGATAIEDKLEQGVAETIACLTLASIKIWVLTGDKMETAINIAYSCNMLRDDMNEVFVISGHSVLEVPPITPPSLNLYMIKTAHIGVGISGQEGMQAVLASDYSFAQFRHLQRLLLVHGRWSYFRMCNFLCYFFYKNFAFTLVHFWFGFFCGFSAQTVYDQWFITLFNIVYTSLPVLAMGLFDQDVNEKNSIRFPKLYEPGQLNLLFNKRQFFLCSLQGAYTSFTLFFIPYGALYHGVRDDGANVTDQQSFAVTIFVILICFQIGLDTNYWTAINHFYIWGSLAVYFSILFAMHSNGIFGIFPSQFPFIGTARSSLSQPVVWLVILLTTVVCVAPVLVVRFLRADLYPTQTDKVNRRQHPHEQGLRRVRRTSSRRSAYAFAHQEGYGELITSGRNMRFTGPAPESGLGSTSDPGPHTWKMHSSSSWIENLLKKRGLTTGSSPKCRPDNSTERWHTEGIPGDQHTD
uniref:Phospholipid-transporting ATPase n=1 Tax=Scleropages formosus TaxID=113540 RepID=A0A8C9VSB5_SCLFO